MEKIELKEEKYFEELKNNIGSSSLIETNGSLYFINMELVNKENIFNQFLGEYLAKLLFSLPIGKSNLFKASQSIINDTTYPHFIDKAKNKYVLLTKMHGNDKELIYTHFDGMYETNISVMQKLAEIKIYLNDDEKFNKVKECFIRLSLLDFYMGQYGRDFTPHVNFSKDNGLHLASIYSFGNSYDFNCYYNEMDSCTTVFGDIDVKELLLLSKTSNNHDFFMYVLTKLNFPYVLDLFSKQSPLLIDRETEERYMDFAKEKQSTLKRNI